MSSSKWGCTKNKFVIYSTNFDCSNTEKKPLEPLNNGLMASS